MTTRATRRSQDDMKVNSDDEETPTFKFNGKIYTTYQEMVNAKRKRNQDVLEASGLLKPPQPPLYTSHMTSNKRNKNKQAQLKAPPQQPSRRSSRLSQSDKPNYKEVSTFIEHQAAVVNKKRPRTTSTESRIVSPSLAAAPAPPAANSVRSINIDTKTLVLGETGVLGQMMDHTGKEFVINESFALAAHPDDQKRLEGSRLSFNKYCGVQEFKNAIFLWINLGSKDNPVVNDFLDDARQVSWFGGSRMHDESPVIHKLLKMGQQHDEKEVGDDNKPHSDIILWCRRYQTDTKKNTPYVCFGRLTYHSHVPQSHPLKFIWNLVDYDGLKNHSDKAVRERFAAFTT
uniref:Uncharacterized protein n=1 Tax=Skeletonema marinoi TaxID=267567 RepID=A0A7S2PPX6_9STRA|mmetsp:Transcript_26832/g.45554  ORF Transcript_26832/g.45554 Transcript_26832/m.45554 type:complete len:344 (+) Transcript_26832:71-1102(+)